MDDELGIDMADGDGVTGAGGATAWEPEDEDDREGYDGDDEDEDGDDEGQDVGREASTRYIERHQAFYEDFETSALVPRIPEEMRGTDILGLRTRGNGTVGIKMGAITNRRKLEDKWQSLSPAKRYILMLVSEHRHLTIDQLSTFLVMPARVRRANEREAKRVFAGSALREELGRAATKAEVDARVDAEDQAMLGRRAARAGKDPAALSDAERRRLGKYQTHDSLRPYMDWLTREKYGQELNYKNAMKTLQMGGLQRMVNELSKDGLLVARDPSYKVREQGATSSYTDTPALFDQHYYLSPLGARVLVANTRIKAPSVGAKSPTVGYVETHLDAAYTSIVHETECTECLLSLVRCAEYLSNVEVFSPMADETGFGYVDVVRCFHEKDCEEKRVDWRGSDDAKGIDFKSDGLVTLFSSRLHDFIDLYLEYDAGSSKRRNIAHKVEAYLKHVLSKMDEFAEAGRTFRKPVLLLVSQKPSSFITAINNGKTTQYTQGIRVMAAKKCFDAVRSDPRFPRGLDDVGLVLVTDCNALRQHGALGACWHRMDLSTGVAEARGYDLLTSVSDFVASNAGR